MGARKAVADVMGTARSDPAGQPGLGARLGAGAGLARNSVGAPIVNASRIAGQNASRIGLARALTGEPSDLLAKALAKRQAGQTVPPLVAEQTKRLTQALMRAGIASAPAGQSYVGAQ